MIINEFSLGMIAQYGLLKDVNVTKKNKGLCIEYKKDDTQHFTSYFINNEFHEALKFCKYVDKNYCELSVTCMSIPKSNKKHLNIECTLTVITENQELIDLRISTEADINFTRMTDGNLFDFILLNFNEHKQEIINRYADGLIPSYKDRLKFGNSLGVFKFLSLDPPGYRTLFY